MKINLLIIAILLFASASCKNFPNTNFIGHDTTIITQPAGPYSTEDSLRNKVGEKYTEGLAKLDSLTGERIEWENKFPAETSTIDSLKKELKLEIKKEKFDFDKANAIVTEYNNKIDDLILHIRQSRKK